MTATPLAPPGNGLPDHCPRCSMSFQGPPIPEKDQEAFGNATHFSLVIAIYDWHRDRTVQFQCPGCHHSWPRT